MGFNYDEFSEKCNKKETAKKILDKIAAYCAAIDKPLINLMEVCGTHTHEIFKSGVRTMLPDRIKLRSGPGCPVCVTEDSYIDGAINMARNKDFIITTFGDMLKVPGENSSLKKEQSAGADVRVVYSPTDSVQIAVENPSKNVVFLGVGFETTAPAVAFLAKDAKERGLKNLFIYEGNKTVPEALKAIANHPAVKIDGFILPGHVSVITGEAAYRAPLAQSGICGVICGFEYIDILLSIEALLKMISEGRHEVRNEYSRVVSESGNTAAQKIINEVFEACDAEWRGIGVIPASGLKLRGEYRKYSAGDNFADIISPAGKTAGTAHHQGCKCGEVLLSVIEPPQCPLFKNVCNPMFPIGPCMVSSEGTCAAFYKYGSSGDKIELE